MITILYSIDTAHLINETPRVTIFIDDNKFVTDLNSFAQFMRESKGCIFIEKKTRKSEFGRFRSVLRRMLG
jgi:hypothetical protein